MALSDGAANLVRLSAYGTKQTLAESLGMSPFRRQLDQQKANVRKVISTVGNTGVIKVSVVERGALKRDAARGD
jgi:hypothetical protein